MEKIKWKTNKKKQLKGGINKMEKQKTNMGNREKKYKKFGEESTLEDLALYATGKFGCDKYGRTFPSTENKKLNNHAQTYKENLEPEDLKKYNELENKMGFYGEYLKQQFDFKKRTNNNFFDLGDHMYRHGIGGQFKKQSKEYRAAKDKGLDLFHEKNMEFHKVAGERIYEELGYFQKFKQKAWHAFGFDWSPLPDYTFRKRFADNFSKQYFWNSEFDSLKEEVSKELYEKYDSKIANETRKEINVLAEIEHLHELGKKYDSVLSNGDRDMTKEEYKALRGQARMDIREYKKESQ